MARPWRSSSVDIYGYDLRYAHGAYVMSGGRDDPSLPSTVVRIETDTGLTGWGETCPLGPTYLPAARGRRARRARASSRPRCSASTRATSTPSTTRWTAPCAGHAYAKAAIDIACWDLLGKRRRRPGQHPARRRAQRDFPLYVAIPLGPVDEMVAHVSGAPRGGHRRFQLKLGADPREDADRVRAVLEATDDGDVSSPTPTAAGACRTRRSPRARSRASTACSSSSPARRSRSA